MLLLSAALVLSAAPAFAKKPEGGAMPAGFEKGNKKGWGESEVPPGFAKGEKKGWKDRLMPWGKKDKEKMEKEGKETKKEMEKKMSEAS